MKKTLKKVNKKIVKSKKETLQSIKTKSNIVKKNILFKTEQIDPAHSYGHRKMNLNENLPKHSGAKVQLQDSAINTLANSDKIRRTNSKNRRIITGATVGKTGRIVIK